LSAGTTYQMCVCAYGPGGSSSWAGPLGVTTSAASYPLNPPMSPVLTGNGCDAIDTNTLSVRSNWTSDSTADSVVPTYYDVCYKSASCNCCSTGLTNSGSHSDSTSVSFQKGELITVCVRNRNAYCTTAWAATTCTFTYIPPLSAPTGLTAFCVQSDVICWCVTNSNSSCRIHPWCLTVGGSFCICANCDWIPAYGTFVTRFCWLDASTTYTLNVRASNFGMSAPIPPYSSWTPINVPTCA